MLVKKIKYIVFIFIFFILGILTANLFNKDDNKNYNLNCKYNNVNIFTSKTYNDKNFSLYLDNLKDISEDLVKNCDNIYFTNENLTEKFNLDIKTKVVAISYGKDIYVNTDYYADDVLSHELFHVYDFSNNWISESSSFLDLYNKYKNDYKVSPGNKENEYEFFATCGEYYLSHSITEQDLYNFYDSLNIQP